MRTDYPKEYIRDFIDGRALKLHEIISGTPKEDLKLVCMGGLHELEKISSMLEGLNENNEPN